MYRDLIWILIGKIIKKVSTLDLIKIRIWIDSKVIKIMKNKCRIRDKLHHLQHINQLNHQKQDLKILLKKLLKLIFMNKVTNNKKIHSNLIVIHFNLWQNHNKIILSNLKIMVIIHLGKPIKPTKNNKKNNINLNINMKIIHLQKISSHNSVHNLQIILMIKATLTVEAECYKPKKAPSIMLILTQLSHQQQSICSIVNSSQNKQPQ